MAVEVRCPAGHPLVVRTYPLVGEGDDRVPFPTLFWLSCPAVRTRVSHLERDGWVGRLERELAADPELRAACLADHRAYAAERWRTLADGDREFAIRRGFAAALRDAGIGGTADPAHLKCLHLHAAHHLARGSAIGRRLETLTSLAGCPALGR